MSNRPSKLREDARAIWQAGVDAVVPRNLLPRRFQVEGQALHIDDEIIDLSKVDRLAVVGAGKAGAGMVQAVETALGDQLLREKRVFGLVNVPADCVAPTKAVRLHAGRPAGVNEPTPEGVEGTEQILEIVGALAANDLCLCLISGGGSALLPAPVAGITLADKLEITRLLSHHGANIEQLNTVRRALSRIKGGGLARSCGAGQLITLIISDVLGDPLEAIASGPTIDLQPQPQDALHVLREFELDRLPETARVVEFLQRASHSEKATEPIETSVKNVILGNNATAVDAAGVVAERLGYEQALVSASTSEGPAEDVGHHLANMASTMRGGSGPTCLISGGEPTVTLVDPAQRGMGGRNQQLVLAALTRLADCERIALLSGGTDGEDGPTDAAGAVVDADVVRAARERGLDAEDFLSRNDAYNFFQPLDALLMTGPTHTNTCDVRVVTVEPDAG